MQLRPSLPVVVKLSLVAGQSCWFEFAVSKWTKTQIQNLVDSYFEYLTVSICAPILIAFQEPRSQLLIE
jgi:hypothetical protein